MMIKEEAGCAWGRPNVSAALATLLQIPASPSPVCFWPRQVTSPQGTFFFSSFSCSHSMVYWWLLNLHGAPLGDFSLIWALGCFSYAINFYITAAMWSLVHMYIYTFTYVCMYACECICIHNNNKCIFWLAQSCLQINSYQAQPRSLLPC